MKPIDPHVSDFMNSCEMVAKAAQELITFDPVITLSPDKVGITGAAFTSIFDGAEVNARKYGNMETLKDSVFCEATHNGVVYSAILTDGEFARLYPGVEVREG